MDYPSEEEVLITPFRHRSRLEQGPAEIYTPLVCEILVDTCKKVAPFPNKIMTSLFDYLFLNAMNFEHYSISSFSHSQSLSRTILP